MIPVNLVDIDESDIILDMCAAPGNKTIQILEIMSEKARTKNTLPSGVIIANEVDEKIIKYKVKAKKDCSIYLFSKEHLQLNIDGKPQFKDYSNIWSTENGIKQIKHLKQNEEFEKKINNYKKIYRKSTKRKIK